MKKIVIIITILLTGLAAQALMDYSPHDRETSFKDQKNDQPDISSRPANSRELILLKQKYDLGLKYQTLFRRHKTEMEELFSLASIVILFLLIGCIVMGVKLWRAKSKLEDIEISKPNWFRNKPHH